jgi:hypothetical protein
MRNWLVLLALTGAAADVAFRWPEGNVSSFATLIFWYLLFIVAALALMKLCDRRWGAEESIDTQP